uniref:DAGKc domain-containing protein n=1 Tax=Globisporangium ultimum (strain ATCC 200006 / CBS 805.95 / DAOM BR144) TaxID=431595 RepID=K3WTL0_GLOUD
MQQPSTVTVEEPTSRHAARRMQCRFYQTTRVDFARGLQLSHARGVELHPLSEKPTAVVAPQTLGKAPRVDVIPWSDILGAAVLTPDQLAHVPGYEPDVNNDKGQEFAIFGCIPKTHVLKRSAPAFFAFGSKLDALSCFGNAARESEVDDVVRATSVTATSSKPIQSSSSRNAPCERMLVQWVFRYVGDDADAVVLHLVHMIQRLADPRIAHSIKPLDDNELPALQRRHQYHAAEIVANVPLDKYDCIVSVGGDGLLSEIVQGIMKRSDWKQAIQQPLGVIPGGSGNGLSASLLHRSGERLDALNAAYALAKGSASELDLATVMNGKQDVVYSFLSLEWAFIADVDIESERYRMFGGMRFTISSVAKLLARHKRYSGTLRYLSSDFDVPGAPPKYHERLSHQEEGASRPALECLPVVDEKDSSPSQWREVSGQFHMFWGMNVSHASSDGHIAPNAPIDDGYYYLMLMDGSFSRMSLTKMLLGLDDGSHIGQKQVQLIRTRAFTLHVDNPADRLCVDGELFDGPEVKVEVHRGLGRVLCLPPLSR